MNTFIILILVLNRQLRSIVKRKVRENNNNKWFSNELRMLKREKIVKYQKALFENSASAWNSYKFIRNIYKVKIGNEKNRDKGHLKI